MVDGQGLEEENIAAAVEAGTDGITVPTELVDDPAPGSSSLAKSEGGYAQRVREMPVGERIKLALRGNREARAILARDSNRMIRLLVLQNPRIGDDEIIALAKNRSADDEVLRLISKGRQWVKNYQVRLALVCNPKTPVAIGIPLVRSLYDRDIRLIAKSKNISQAIATQAKRIVNKT